jgi:polysaccharide deacetylase family protein (PEP-CTERM system associated)
VWGWREALSSTHSLTIDVEDWPQIIGSISSGAPCLPTDAVAAQTEALLAWLAEVHVQATFFVVADIAIAHPRLIREIRSCGHEVACHGLTHAVEGEASVIAFREHVRAAKGILESVLGQPVLGYRAPNFSIAHESKWAFKVLAEEGFLYDSSVLASQSRRSSLYPKTSFGEPEVLHLGAGRELTEFRVSAVSWAFRRWPAGGTYLHFLPYRRVRATLSADSTHGRPTILYYHPYQLPHSNLKLKVPVNTLRARLIASRYRLLHTCRRGSAFATLSKLAEQFEFVPLAERLSPRVGPSGA